MDTWKKLQLTNMKYKLFSVIAILYYSAACFAVNVLFDPIEFKLKNGNVTLYSKELCITFQKTQSNCTIPITVADQGHFANPTSVKNTDNNLEIKYENGLVVKAWINNDRFHIRIYPSDDLIIKKCLIINGQKQIMLIKNLLSLEKV